MSAFSTTRRRVAESRDADRFTETATSAFPTTQASRRQGTDDWFVTTMMMAIFLPAVLLALAWLGSSLFTAHNVFLVILGLGAFVLYNFRQSRP